MRSVVRVGVLVSMSEVKCNNVECETPRLIVRVGVQDTMSNTILLVLRDRQELSK